VILVSVAEWLLCGVLKAVGEENAYFIKTHANRREKYGEFGKDALGVDFSQ